MRTVLLIAIQRLSLTGPSGLPIRVDRQRTLIPRFSVKALKRRATALEHLGRDDEAVRGELWSSLYPAVVLRSFASRLHRDVYP